MRRAQPKGHRPRVLCQAQVQQHTRNTGPDTSQLKPYLQEQWDVEANKALGNIIITPQSNKKAQWSCRQCPDGHAHVWQALVSSRTNGAGCPYCAGKTVCQHNSLATQSPQLLAEWDSGANDLTPDDYTGQSGARVAWKCHRCQHRWTARIQHRTQLGHGCPMCGRERRKPKRKHPSVAASGPHVMAEWDHENNERAGLDPSLITLGSVRHVHWVCSKCPLGSKHRWMASPNARQLYTSHPRGCPCCAGHQVCKCNCLQTIYPEIVNEWDYAKNDTTPTDHTASSGYTAWWLNSKRGSWQQSIKVRSINVFQSRRRERLDSS